MRDKKGVAPPPIPKGKGGGVLDITDEAELVESLRPPRPKRSEAPSIEVREEDVDDDDDE